MINGGSANIGLAAQISQALGGTFGVANYGASFAPAQNITLSKSTTLASAFSQVVMQGRTVTSGTPDAVNLSSGLVMPDGAAFAVTDIVALGLKNNGIAGQTISFGAGSGAVTSILGATGVLTLLPGAYFTLLCPNAVGSCYGITVTTADKLQVTVAAGTAVPYDFCVFSH